MAVLPASRSLQPAGFGGAVPKTTDTLPFFYGPLPVAYLKLVKGNFNVEIGELPTLVGAEYTFDFENMNIERGLLWNQENAISRGVQVSDTFKKLSLTVSWNDGFYSNVYNWITGSASYAFNSSNTLAFVGGGNVGADGRDKQPLCDTTRPGERVDLQRDVYVQP